MQKEEYGFSLEGDIELLSYIIFKLFKRPQGQTREALQTLFVPNALRSKRSSLQRICNPLGKYYRQIANPLEQEKSFQSFSYEQILLVTKTLETF
jgi:hypothetical protein